MVHVSPREIAFLTDWRGWFEAAKLTLYLVAIYMGLTYLLRRKESTMAGKRYGGGAKAAQRLDQAHQWELEVLRFDEEEVHEFTTVRKVDTLLAAQFMNIGEDDAGRLLRVIGKLIGKTLDNADGVPVQWAAVALPKPKNAKAGYEPKFRGPDGKLYPMDQAVKFEEIGQGSSRRRWEALLVDEDATTALDSLAEITKDLIEVSTGGRPTVGS